MFITKRELYEKIRDLEDKLDWHIRGGILDFEHRISVNGYSVPLREIVRLLLEYLDVKVERGVIRLVKRGGNNALSTR